MDDKNPKDIALIRKNLFKLRLSIPAAKQLGLFILRYIEYFEKQSGQEVFIGETKKTD